MCSGALQVTGLECAFHVDHLLASASEWGKNRVARLRAGAQGVNRLSLKLVSDGAGLQANGRVDFLTAWRSSG